MYNLTDEECKYALGIGFSNILSNKNPEDVIDFMSRVFSSIVIAQNNYIMKKWKHNIIKIPVNEITSLDFEISREGRVKLLKEGSESARNWLEGKASIKPLRLHSLV